jgi:hypothetical protein
MEEIKKRDMVVRGFLARRCGTLYRAADLECICLQVRKILELIALGSLVVNKEEFSKYHEKFYEYWNARRILKDIEKINPNFYPVPVKESPSTDPKAKTEWRTVTEGFLTKDDFVEVYDKCSRILHADNPFGSSTDYSDYDDQISEWMGRIVRLLQSHIIHLLNDDNLYLIHMREKRDDRVHGYIFAPISSTDVGSENLSGESGV